MTDKQDSIQDVLEEIREWADEAVELSEHYCGVERREYLEQHKVFTQWADRIESLLNAEPVAWVLLGKDGALHYRSVPPTATIAESYETRPPPAAAKKET